MDKRYKVKDLKIGKIYLYDLRIGKEEDINKYIIFDSTNVDRAYINGRFIGKSIKFMIHIIVLILIEI